MEPGFRLRKTMLRRWQLRIPPAKERGASKTRTRRLTFEICEPRLPLAALPMLPLADDMPLVDRLQAAEFIAGSFETSSGDPTHAVPAAPATDLCVEEPNPDASPSEIVVADGDDSEGSSWNSLGAGPKEMSLTATFEEANGQSTEQSSWGQESLPLLGQTGPNNPVAHEAAGPDRLDEFSAIAALATASSGLEGERREWTAATTVRYPLADAGRTQPSSAVPFPRQAATPSLVFLDVARVATPTTTSLRLGLAASTAMDAAVTTAPLTSLETEFATDSPARVAAAQKPPAVSTSRARLAITGDSRAQRIMLLASKNPRPHSREQASFLPDSSWPPEALHVQGQGAERSSESSGGAQTLDVRRARVGIPNLSKGTTGPLGDDRASRSTMGGIATLLLLTTGWLTKTFAPTRRRQPGLPDPGLFHTQQMAASDHFFKQLSRP